MKASEAEPLTQEELNILEALLKRWILLKHPFHGGSSEESDALQTYDRVAESAVAGEWNSSWDKKELKKMMERHGEMEL
jgi:hypothetical protein